MVLGSAHEIGENMGIADILRALAAGEFDGERSDIETNGVSAGFYIQDGTPVQYREGASTRFFDGRENVRTPGKRTEHRFETEDEKILFFQKYGFKKDMFGGHPDVIEYSRNYYENKKQ